jgi:hypothetical protein
MSCSSDHKEHATVSTWNGGLGPGHFPRFACAAAPPAPELPEFRQLRPYVREKGKGKRGDYSARTAAAMASAFPATT